MTNAKINKIVKAYKTILIESNKLNKDWIHKKGTFGYFWIYVEEQNCWKLDCHHGKHINTIIYYPNRNIAVECFNKCRNEYEILK